MQRRPRSRGESTPPASAVGLAVAILAAAVVLVGCSPPDEKNCEPECSATFRCDPETDTCRARRLSELGLQPPGRGLDTATVGDATHLSAIHPSEQTVVAGRAGDELDLRTVGALGSRGPQQTAIAGGSTAGLAVLWRGTDGRFRIARRLDGRWRRPVAVDTEEDYASTGDFDLAVDPEGNVHVLYRGGDSNALRHLSRSTDGSWNVDLIDDGSAVETRSSCPPGGADPDRPGVGYDPDAKFLSLGLGPSLAVTYYDGDCGDLRLARRSEDTWTVRVVTTGAFSIRGASGRYPGDVGRFSSLAAEPDGDLAVAYQDARRGRLAYASETAGSFGTAPVDPGIELDARTQKRKQLVGAFADLGFDSRGRPYIGYFNGSTTRLRFAYRAQDQNGNRRWFHRAVGPEAPSGFHADLVVGETRVTLFAERLVAVDGTYRSRLIRTRVDKP